MNYKKTKLKNGLRIITAPMRDTQTATVIILAGVGSRYESEKEAGLSHFIEHMLFKGTAKRPNTLAISQELDSVGGEYNAFTWKDRTGYYVKVASEHIFKALDVVSDMYLNSKIESEEIKKEKGTILQELNMYEDMPVRSVEDFFEKTLYPKTDLGREIIGYKKTIKSFSRKDFLRYMRRFYVANNTVVCVAGKFDEKKVLSEIRKIFSKMRKGKKPKAKKATISENQKPELKVKFKKTDQTHLVLGVPAYDWNHKDRFALMLLGVILGGSMSSRLFSEVREKRGLAYYVSCSVESFEDTGYIAARAGVEHKNIQLTVKTILHEFGKICREKVTQEELQRAKDLVKGRAVMGLESSDEVAGFFSGQEVLKGKITTISQRFALIDKVTPDDIMKVAQDVFQKEKLKLAVIGPHKKTREIKKILKL